MIVQSRDIAGNIGLTDRLDLLTFNFFNFSDIFHLQVQKISCMHMQEKQHLSNNYVKGLLSIPYEQN